MIIESIAKYLTGRRHIENVTRIADNIHIRFDNGTMFDLHLSHRYPKTVNYDIHWDGSICTSDGSGWFDFHNDPPTEDQLGEFYLHAMRDADIDFWLDV